VDASGPEGKYEEPNHELGIFHDAKEVIINIV